MTLEKVIKNGNGGIEELFEVPVNAEVLFNNCTVQFYLRCLTLSGHSLGANRLCRL